MHRYISRDSSVKESAEVCWQIHRFPPPEESMEVGQEHPHKYVAGTGLLRAPASPGEVVGGTAQELFKGDAALAEGELKEEISIEV